jgi:hypothetical protein
MNLTVRASSLPQRWLNVCWEYDGWKRHLLGILRENKYSKIPAMKV